MPDGADGADGTDGAEDHTLGVKALNHLAHAYPTRDELGDWYERLFGMRTIFRSTGDGAGSGFRTRVLDHAARQIRTGQVQLAAMTQAQFRQLICNKIGPILSCDANLQIDVETYTSFNAASFASPLRPDKTLNPNLNNWQPGNECSIVLVRAFYTWAVATPVLTPFMVNMAGSKHLMSATAAFRNEPYTTAVAGC